LKRSLALLAAALLAASPAPYAQKAGGEAAKAPPAPRFDCSRARDPQGCEARLAKMREARERARKACAGKSGEQRRDCMEKSFCAEAADPGKCESNLEERAVRRRAKREQDKKLAK
jgi:hypothetical protein